MNGLNARLCQIINDHGSNVAQLARDVGVARRSIHRWINGSQEPMPKYLHKINRIWPDVDLHWLLTGDHFYILADLKDGDSRSKI